MPKAYTRRINNSVVWGSLHSCAFVTRIGFWRPSAKFQSDPYAPPTYEQSEEHKERLRGIVEEILTKSETIPVIVFTTDHEADMKELLREYPEYITLASETKTQHTGEHHMVQMWVAQLHKRPADAV